MKGKKIHPKERQGYARNEGLSEGIHIIERQREAFSSAGGAVNILRFFDPL